MISGNVSTTFQLNTALTYSDISTNLIINPDMFCEILKTICERLTLNVAQELTPSVEWLDVLRRSARSSGDSCSSPRTRTPAPPRQGSTSAQKSCNLQNLLRIVSNFCWQHLGSFRLYRDRSFQATIVNFCSMVTVRFWPDFAV